MQIEEDIKSQSYDYLLTMPLWSLSFEKIEEINKEKTDLEK